MKLERSSGILLHPTSLPNGVLDDQAYRFVDWLSAAGQQWWQVLPLGPPEGITGSPYMSPCAFAGSPGLIAESDACVTRTDAEEFRASNSYWIDDWLDYGGSLEDQVRFEREWRALREYAGRKGVRLFGDIPIYVAHDGADHRAHPRLFRKGEVAGVPPDAFTRTGQLWGNPLYDWSAMRADGYRWWIERLRRTFELVDLTRIDHFRGFVSYWAVPEGNKTATKGRWLRGPGAELFHAVQAKLGELPVVAEDLGVITEPVVRLRRELGLPGMVVLQFALGKDPSNPHLPQNHEQQSVVYTGTHDNDTTRGWWESLSPEDREWSGLDPADPARALLEVAWSSPAALAVAPLQDIFSLGNEARMNLPGSEEGNWHWRFSEGQLTDEN
ncbi:MAG: 4-alpha-glucanotransferase, partial [Acidimicrobiaceae bacterium]